MLQRWVLALVLAAPWSMGWCAMAPQAPPGADKYQAWCAAAALQLAARTDANSLATAAALMFAGSRRGPKVDAAALGLVSRASALAPDDDAIAWLRLELCANAPDCDFRDAATTMRWIAADNAAAWMPTLMLAQRDRDSTEIDRILADMALGKRFDVYWNRINVMMFDTLENLTSLRGGAFGSDAGRLYLVAGIASVEAIPTYFPLINACREPKSGPDRREACLKLSKTMQQGDAVTTQIAGLAIEKRFVSPDGKEAHALDERRRTLDYRVKASAKFNDPLLPWLRNARARRLIARMRLAHREEDVCISILRELGLGVDPPP
jgi:hypothetical protein